MVEISYFWGSWATQAFSTTFTSLGGTITGRHQVSSTDDFTETLDTIVGEGPDAIYFAHDNGDAAGIFSKMADLKGFSTIAWSTSTEDKNQLDNFVAQAGSAAEDDVAMMFYRHSSDMAGYPLFNSLYQWWTFPNYGDEATSIGAFAYDAAHIIIEAISVAGSLNPREIRSAIATTSNYSGVVGVYKGFDNKGDVIPQWFWLVGYKEENWHQLYPYEVYLPLLLK